MQERERSGREPAPPFCNEETQRLRWGGSAGTSWPSPESPDARASSIDDFNDSMGTRIDQHGAIIDNGVAILGDTVLPRDFVVGHATRGEVSADMTGLSVGPLAKANEAG